MGGWSFKKKFLNDEKSNYQSTLAMKKLTLFIIILAGGLGTLINDGEAGEFEVGQRVESETEWEWELQKKRMRR